MPGYGKYRSPEEKEEFVKQLGADAKQRVIDLAENWEADAKDVAEFLIFSSRFPDYSVRNQMLIYKQNPYAMFTAGYNQFEKMGYTVQKGEKGMRIWVPHNITYYRGKESEPWKRLTKSTPKAVRDMIKAGMLETREELQFYRYGVVFDIAQTNCPAEDYPKLVGLGCADELHAAAFDIISEYSNRCGMPVRTIDLKSVALRGYYKWLYYLGVFKRRPKVYGSAFATARWQLNAYIKQFDYVAAHNIKTRDDVEQRLRVVQHEISGQIDEREEIRAVLRRLETGDAEIQEQLEKIEKINAQLKKLRTEAKLCVQILEQQPQIKSKIDKAHEVKTFETERGKENGRTSDHHLEHRRNEAAPTREQRSSGSARSSDPIQRR